MAVLAARGHRFGFARLVRRTRPLICIDGQYVIPVGNAHDLMTLQLAKEAWHHYSA